MFTEMLTGRHGKRLDSWMAAVDADELPHLHHFDTGLRRDSHIARNGPCFRAARAPWLEAQAPPWCRREHHQSCPFRPAQRTLFHGRLRH